jgi:purine-binding chemotaxis protein CheW
LSPSALLIVQHGRERIGFDLGVVREVVRMLMPRGLPGAPPGVLGVMDLRGEMIPMLELEARLPAGAGKPGVDHRVVVLDVGIPLAVVVSRVDDIEATIPEAYRSAKGNLPEGVPIGGIARTSTGLIPVLDPRSLLKPGEVMELQELVRRLAEEQP